MNNTLFTVNISGGYTVIVNNLESIIDAERKELTIDITNTDINWFNFNDGDTYYFQDNSETAQYDYTVKTNKSDRIILLTQLKYN